MQTNTSISSAEALNYALLLRGADKGTWEIKDELVKRGLSELDAQLIADRADELYTKERHKGANRKIVVGLLFFVGGIVVTVVTMKSGNGGIIAWGAIVFGVIDMCIGIYQRTNS